MLQHKNRKRVVVSSCLAAALSLTGVALAEDTMQPEESSGAHGAQDAQRAEPRHYSLSQANSEQIEEVQRKLADRGLYSGQIDGIVGPRTRAALTQFHAQQGIEGSEFGPETAEALGVDWEVQPVSGAEPQAESSHGQAQQQPGGEQRSDNVRLSNLNEDQSRKLQQKLQELGFYPGPIDGIIGPGTRGGLSRYFQRQAQLAGQGMLGESGLSAFGMEADDVQPVAGEEEQQPGQQAEESGTTEEEHPSGVHEPQDPQPMPQGESQPEGE